MPPDRHEGRNVAVLLNVSDALDFQDGGRVRPNASQEMAERHLQNSMGISYKGRSPRSGLMRQVLFMWFFIMLSASTAVAQSLDGRLKLLRDTATLRIAYRTDSPPFSYLDAQGKPTGYTIELCERIGKSIERELALPSLAIKWVALDTRSRFGAISEGFADMECGSTSISLSRMRIVDFSNIVFADSTGVLVKANAGIINFDSMAGKSIAVLPGSTNMQAIRDQLN